MAQVTELVTKFLFEGDTAPLARYNKELGASIKLIAGAALAAVAAGGAIAKWAGQVLEGVDALGDLSAETGVAVSRIQELGYAATLSDSSAAALENSLRGLSGAVGLAANDMGRGKEIFKELGVNVRDSNGHVKNAAVVLDEVRQRMNALNMSMDERRGFATRLGIDGTLIQFLARTDEEMKGLITRARELGTLTDEQAAAAGEYSDALNVMNYAMTAIRQQVAVGLAPALTSLAETFTDLLAENKEWIIDGLRATTEFIGNLLMMIKRLLPVLALLGAAFILAKVYMLGFAGVAAIVFAPVVLITGAIAALLIVVDDLIVAFKGGDSVIGDFFKNFLDIDLSKTVEWLKSIWEWVTKIASALTGNIGKLFAMGSGSPMVALAGANPGAFAGRGVMGSNVSNNSKIEQTVNMEIKTSDPAAAGRAAVDGMQRQLKDANGQLGVGGR